MFIIILFFIYPRGDFMSIFIKKFMVLTASLMVGTSCFATDDNTDLVKRSYAKATARELERENSTTVNIPTTLASPDTPFSWETLNHDVHNMLLVKIAEADREDFKNMLLVSKSWFSSLTGTGESNLRSNSYPKYVFVLDRYDTENYKSLRLLHNLRRVKVATSLKMYEKIRKGKVKEYPLICNFLNPNALTSLSLVTEYVDMKSMTSLTNLEKLNLSVCHLKRNADLHPLSSLTKLQDLNLSSNRWRKLTSISSLSPQSLTALDLSENKLDASILSPFTNLVKLDLEGCHLGPEGLKYLSPLTKLKNLNLADNEKLILNDTSLMLLPENLTALDLSHNPLTNVSILSRFANLEELRLASCCLNSECFSTLSLLLKLKTLNLAENKDLRTLEPLSSFTNLTDLS